MLVADSINSSYLRHSVTFENDDLVKGSSIIKWLTNLPVYQQIDCLFLETVTFYGQPRKATINH